MRLTIHEYSNEGGKEYYAEVTRTVGPTVDDYVDTFNAFLLAAGFVNRVVIEDLE